MGGYAQFCIRTLIGWLKTIASQMWVLFSGQNSGGLLGWVSNHWKVICIGLCVVGTLADLTVYIFRWEPIKVWKSYFRRRKNKNHVTWTDESELIDTYQDYSHETDYPEDHPYHKEYQPQPFQNKRNTNISSRLLRNQCLSRKMLSFCHGRPTANLIIGQCTGGRSHKAPRRTQEVRFLKKTAEA